MKIILFYCDYCGNLINRNGSRVIRFRRYEKLPIHVNPATEGEAETKPRPAFTDYEIDEKDCRLKDCRLFEND